MTSMTLETRVTMTKAETKYDVAKEYSAGFAASLLPSTRSLSESDHWLAGWDAGYALRTAKNERLNQYLKRNGHEQMATVRASDVHKFHVDDLSSVDWGNDLLFFTHEVSQESSQFDPKARWVPGGEYYETTYRVRVPLAFRDCDELIEEFVQLMDENHPETVKGFYVD